MTSVLFVSASMGAGHDGAARELALRVESAGGRSRVVDLLSAVPRPIAAAWRRGYRAQLRLAPESYERSYRLYYRESRNWDRTLRVISAATRRSIEQWIDESQADVIVSTYALGTLVLGSLREAGQLPVPAVNFLTDFGVHPRTVHRGIDVHLAVHEVAAAAARLLVDAPVITTGPAVSPRFVASSEARRHARTAMGLSSDQRVVVIAAGSWGVGGDLAGTIAQLANDGRFEVVALCAHDQRLARRLEARGVRRVIGWTDQMPTIFAAAYAVVENAGGLTAFEACASGAALVSFRPIPGHGRDNVRAMVRAGVTAAPQSLPQLLRELDAVTVAGAAREARLAAAHAMFTSDPAEPILALAQR
jgi:UDP-N-acetylglucosamine:LPS N-acetylglucosamine transferase